jgi:hypothetical protein
LVKAEPFKACGPLENAEEMKNKIVIAERGECMFNDKVRNHYMIFIFVSNGTLSCLPRFVNFKELQNVE